MRSSDLDRATIPSLQRRMSRGQLTATALTEAYLSRIHTLDGKLHSILTVNPRARASAAASDKRRAAGRLRGPLDGIPVLLKDNIGTASMPTTAGSRALRDSRPKDDATLVRRLKAAGAVILGKTNLSEWANFRSRNSTSGWSALGGQTANPHVLNRNPCGSSSGSAAAVAASLAQVAIGSETDGSIVCPGGMCGVVGHKPSLGLVSRAGMVPISAQQDTAGPMTRHVIDAAITLSVLQGRDPLDEVTSTYPADQPGDYAALLAPESLRGARIGVWRIPELGDGTAAVLRSTVKLLRSRGATVVEITMPYQDRIRELEFPALLTEFRHGLEAYLAGLDGGPKTIAELIAFNREDPLEQACFPDQELFEEAVAAPAPGDQAYLDTRAEVTELARRSIDETLAAHRLDAIVSPSNPPAWRSNCATGDPDLKMYMSSSSAAVAGYPTITVPAGAVGNLPVGVSFLAGRWQDAKILAYAAELEQHAKARLTPRFRAS